MYKRTKLARVLEKEEVRQVCINHNYYTRGDNKAYENMLGELDYRSKHTGSNITSIKLKWIAEDIKDHSNTEDSVREIMEHLCCHIKVELFDREELDEDELLD